MSPQIESLKNMFSELFAKLMAFCLEEEFIEYLGESLEIFYNLQPGEEYEFDPSEEFLFLSWFLLDDGDANGDGLIDEFLKRHSDELSLEQMQISKALKDTHLTLLKVVSVTPEVSMRLKDLFTGEEFEVNEAISEVISEDKEKTASCIENHVLYTRVLKLGDARFLVGAGIFLDSSITKEITTFVTDQYKQDCENGQTISFKDFLKHNGELINWWIRAYEKGESLDDLPDGDKEPPTPPEKSPSCN